MERKGSGGTVRIASDICRYRSEATVSPYQIASAAVCSLQQNPVEAYGASRTRIRRVTVSLSPTPRGISRGACLAAQTAVAKDPVQLLRDLRTAIQDDSLASAAELAGKLDQAVQERYSAWLIRDADQRTGERRGCGDANPAPQGVVWQPKPPAHRHQQRWSPTGP